MNKALISLAYRQVIDASSSGQFERDIFNDTYYEFLMQVQEYNPQNQYKTWQQVRTAVPKSAAQLPPKVGFAISLYIQALQNQIPDLQDSLGRTNLTFSDYRFELIDSDITDKSAHRVALTYQTDTLTLLGVVGNYLLLSLGDQTPTLEQSATTLETFMIEMRPGLAIASYAEWPNPIPAFTLTQQ